MALAELQIYRKYAHRRAMIRAKYQSKPLSDWLVIQNWTYHKEAPIRYGNLTFKVESSLKPLATNSDTFSSPFFFFRNQHGLVQGLIPNFPDNFQMDKLPTVRRLLLLSFSFTLLLLVLCLQRDDGATTRIAGQLQARRKSLINGWNQ